MDSNCIIVIIFILQINYIIGALLCFSVGKTCIFSSCSNAECINTASRHIQEMGYVTIDADFETISFTCNPGHGLVGSSIVKCDRCNRKLIGDLPTCQRLVFVSTKNTIEGLTTSVTVENNTNDAAFITKSTTASVDGPLESKKSQSNREKLSMQNLSLIVISLVLIVILVGLITFIWLRRCKMESLCWYKQPQENSSRVISECDDTYDLPMMQFTTETQTIRQCRKTETMPKL